MRNPNCMKRLHLSIGLLILIFFTGLSAFSQDIDVSSSSKPTKKLPIPGEVFEVNGCTAFLISPEGVEEERGDRPWIWHAPTLPPYPGDAERWMFEKFLAAGISIAGIDVGESYGSPKGTALFSELHKELTEHRNMSSTPGLLARSRGGLMLLSWAASHPDKVACIGGIYPVCDLSSYPGVDRAASAYEISSDELQANLDHHNPIPRLKKLAENRVPIHFLQGDSDTVVPLEPNSMALANMYWSHGGPMTLDVFGGQGHNMWPGWFQNQELVDFLIENSLKK